MAWSDGGGRAGAEPGRMRLRTLLAVRWVVIVGQLLLILLVDRGLDVALPLLPMLAAVGLSAALNLALTMALPSTTRLDGGQTALVLAYDLAQISFLLALSGGLQNPFAVLLLLPMTLAAGALGLRATAALAALALALITILAFPVTPVPWPDGGLVPPGAHLVVLWSALALATVLVAVSSWRVAEEARRMADGLAAAQRALAREQELAALAGLAAAVAHDLGSPLATIQVTAKDLARALPADHPLREDAVELLEQARRCREILAALGRPRDSEEHEPFTRAPLSSLLESLASEHRRPGVALQVRVAGAEAEPVLTLPPDVRHALANLIDNAVRHARSEVEIRVHPRMAGIELSIEDDGPGFAPEVRALLGEPYLSSRREKEGLGLGVFIAMTLLARTGARVHFDNGRRGARVTVTWPRRSWLPRRCGEEASDGGRGREPAAAGPLG